MLELETVFRRYPDLHKVLWIPNFFHGSAIMDLATPIGKKSLMANDASDALLSLAHHGFIIHAKFRPSVSEGALLGLSYHAYKNSHKEPPNCGNAHAFDWEVIMPWRETK